MYDICEKVWVIIDIFDTPKECTVLDYKKENGIIKGYTVKYKEGFFYVYNEDVYPTQIDANIYWSIIMQQDYFNTLKHPDIFLTDEYEKAFRLASKLLSKYVEECPHILLKYL